MPGPKYVKDFEFPSDFGFTGSNASRVPVRSYDRARPQRFAKGGRVRKEEGGLMKKAKDFFFGKDEPEAEDNPREEAAEKQPPSKDTISPPKGGLVDTLSGKRRRELEKELGLKKGGKVEKKWIKGATKNKGALHRHLGVPEGEKIPAKKLAKGAKSKNPTIRKEVTLAKTLGKLHKAKGGAVKGPEVRGHMRRSMMHESSYEYEEGKPPHRHMAKGSTVKKAMGGGVRAAKGGMAHSDEAQDRTMIRKLVKPSALRR